MKQRLYRNLNDLFAVGTLLRRVFAKNRNWNAWSPARFDIWAQRRIADAEYFGNTTWQNDMALWENENGELIGAVAFTDLSSHRWDSNQIAMFGDPHYPQLIETMLAWANEHHAELGQTQVERIVKLAPRKIEPHSTLAMEVMTSNLFVESILQTHGYAPEKDWMIKRYKSLGNTDESVNLPDSFVLKTLDVDTDSINHMASVKIVFNFQDTIDAYRSIQRAPSYAPNLDLIIVSPENIVASFCTIWVDWENRIGEFEPVGTHPDFRRRGLGLAIITEACNRLRSMDINTVGVESWSESLPANQLYDAAGLSAYDKIFSWTRQPK